MKGVNMEDKQIVELYLNRDEKAIYETQIKYGKYCYSISYNILYNNEDVQECLNDTYLNTWNSIPPNRPSILSTYLGKIIRRLSIDLFRKRKAVKRSGSEYALSLDELEECVSNNIDSKDLVDEKILVETINEFLAKLSKTERNIFVCRYFYFDSINDICKRFNFNESKVKMSLKRTRDRLKDYLIMKGFTL